MTDLSDLIERVEAAPSAPSKIRISNMGENPELIAMARRIAASCVEPSDGSIMNRSKREILAGRCDNWHGVRAALAAIIETQERDAALAETAYKGVTSGPRYIAGRFIAKMIRSGQHYGKDHSHA